MAQVAIIEGFSGSTAPSSYRLPTGQVLQVLAVRADFDGTGAAGDFVPQVSYYAQDGRKLGSFPAPSSVTAGESAGVTFFPTAPPSKGGTSSSLIVTDGTHTVNPATEIDFTSGATVTDLGGGTAGVAITYPANLVEVVSLTSTSCGTLGAQLPWTHSGGVALLSYTTATQPTVIASGVYAVQLEISSDPATPPAAAQQLQAFLNVHTSFAYQPSSAATWTAPAGWGGGQGYMSPFSVPVQMAAGDSFSVTGFTSVAPAVKLLGAPVCVVTKLS